jgi:TRAP-type uncharacterized transport system substrate-binding protein
MRMRALILSAVIGLVALSASVAWSQQRQVRPVAPTQPAPQQEIRWGAPPVGTAGHKALVVLASLLNKEMPAYRIVVLPTAGAIATVKGYAIKDLDGYYGSDIAFREFARDTDRFMGFKARAQRIPMQSFWSNTLEVGLAIHVRNKNKIKSWGDLAGKRVFTGPLPFDTRVQTERALAALGVKFVYPEIALPDVGPQLESGAIDATTIYTSSESAPPPWLAEVTHAADWAALNPTAAEVATLRQKGFSVVEVAPQVYGRDTHTDKVVQLPFYYGFDVGLEVPENDLYAMLGIIERHAAELAKADPTFSQIAKDMAAFQKRGIESSADLVPIHPGLARWMREKGAWNPRWDGNVAQP